MSTPEQQAEYHALLEDAIQTAGSLAGAAQAIGRDVRTLRRWRDGQHPIPDVIVSRLRAVVVGHPRAPTADLARLRQTERSILALQAGFVHLASLAEQAMGQLRLIADELAVLSAGVEAAGAEDDDADAT